jgi:hypothetical protein
LSSLAAEPFRDARHRQQVSVDLVMVKESFHLSARFWR